MIINSSVLIILFIAICVLFFLIGYLIGKMSVFNGVSNDTKSFLSNRQDNHQGKQNKITIDDKKYVVDIKTDNLEKKYDTLGEKKVSEDNISTSVDKLKNLKR